MYFLGFRQVDNYDDFETILLCRIQYLVNIVDGAGAYYDHGGEAGGTEQEDPVLGEQTAGAGEPGVGGAGEECGGAEQEGKADDRAIGQGGMSSVQGASTNSTKLVLFKRAHGVHHLQAWNREGPLPHLQGGHKCLVT